MEQLKAYYDAYIAEAEQVWKNRPAWDGALGLGPAIKDHPCHMAFYENVEGWVENFLKTDPTQEVAEAAISLVLQTSEDYKGRFPYWPMFAAHGLMRPLVAWISPRHAGDMRKWYDAHLPRPDRMPAHKELYKLLKKRENA